MIYVLCYCIYAFREVVTFFRGNVGIWYARVSQSQGQPEPSVQIGAGHNTGAKGGDTGNLSKQSNKTHVRSSWFRDKGSIWRLPGLSGSFSSIRINCCFQTGFWQSLHWNGRIGQLSLKKVQLYKRWKFLGSYGFQALMAFLENLLQIFIKMQNYLEYCFRMNFY